jgi:exodeoxyribonuclease VII large subunit
MSAAEARIERLRTALVGLDPTAVLARGYSITLNGEGHVISNSQQVNEGERLRTVLATGWLESEVKNRK